MSIGRCLLAIIGRRFPAIYDVRFPRGPLSIAGQSRLSEVALNPQPLPPHEIGAAVASEFIRLAWLSESIDRALERSVSSIEMAIG